MQNQTATDTPSPFKPTKRKVLKLDATARRVAARRIADTRAGKYDDDQYDRDLQEFLQTAVRS